MHRQGGRAERGQLRGPRAQEVQEDQRAALLPRHGDRECRRHAERCWEVHDGPGRQHLPEDIRHLTLQFMDWIIWV